MFNAERLLGNLLQQGLRSSRRNRRRGRRNRGSALTRLVGGVGGATLGMGVVGIALAAYEHFTQENSAGTRGGVPSAAAPPPLPLSSQPASAPPPPPPGSAVPPPLFPASGTPRISDAELLVHAMVAAANADGEIDETELKAIRRRSIEAGLTSEERAYLEEKLASPPTLADILSRITDPRLGVQIYAVSLAAIEVDSEAERDYLRRLREGLQLSEEVVRHLHDEFGLGGNEEEG